MGKIPAILPPRETNLVFKQLFNTVVQIVYSPLFLQLDEGRVSSLPSATAAQIENPAQDSDQERPQEERPEELAGRGKRADPKTKILLAAGPIFAQKGFRDTTIREVCERAGVNVASVNYHFGDKQTLYHEAVLYARETNVARTNNSDWQVSLNSLDDHNPRAKLHAMVLFVVQRMVVNETAPWQVQLLLNEMQNPTQTCEHLAQEYFRPFMESLMQIIQRIAGCELDPSHAAKLAMSVVGQCMIYRFAPQARQMTLGSMFDADPTLESDRSSHAGHQEQQRRELELESLADLITRFSFAGIRAATKP